MDYVVPHLDLWPLIYLHFYFLYPLGKDSGRRTNLDAITQALGLESRNNKSEKTVVSDVANKYGHARGRSILQLATKEPVSELFTKSSDKGSVDCQCYS